MSACPNGAYPLPLASGHGSCIKGEFCRVPEYMTLRDRFACSIQIPTLRPEDAAAILGEPTAGYMFAQSPGVLDQIARASAVVRYRIADAMLAQRVVGTP
jgi:hypothetical protein